MIVEGDWCFLATAHDQPMRGLWRRFQDWIVRQAARFFYREPCEPAYISLTININYFFIQKTARVVYKLGHHSLKGGVKYFMYYSKESYEDKIRRLAEDFREKHGEAAHDKVSAQIKSLESSGLHSDASTWKLVREEIRRRSLPDSSQNMTAVE